MQHPEETTTRLKLTIQRLLSQVMIQSPKKSMVGQNKWFIAILLFIVFILFLAAVQFSTPNMPDNDGYYHIKMAYLMRTEGFKPSFPWLPLTILNPREFYDHHFLFHVALIPFTFGDLRVGAKIASVVFAGLAFVTIWFLLRNQKVPISSLWSIGLLAVSEAFIYRMSITRAQSLSLATLILGLNWLLIGKHKPLFILGFFYVWLYNAFPLLLGVAGIYVISVWLIDHKLDLKPLIYTGAGILAGLLINPYFPFNIIFAFQHILPKLINMTAISVGNEWYPYDTGQLLNNSPLTFFAFISGVVALGLNPKKMDTRTAISLGLVIMFGVMLFQSRRFIEYFPAFVLIFTAIAWMPIINALGKSNNDIEFGKNISFVHLFRPYIPSLLLAIILLPSIWKTYQDSKFSIGTSKPYELYSNASDWLESNTPEGSRVFQTDWDDFPRLFFYNNHNTYLIGLDPTYVQLYDSGLYDSWVEITNGRVKNPSQTISASFGADYIITDLNHNNFISIVRNDPNLKQVYIDKDAIVYQVMTP